jgi:hypothetical protein
MEDERNPKDPRVVFAGSHRERGRAKYTFTYEDIATAAGVSLKTVRNAAAKHEGHAELDPRDLESVIRFVLRRRSDLLEMPAKRKRRSPRQ